MSIIDNVKKPIKKIKELWKGSNLITTFFTRYLHDISLPSVVSNSNIYSYYPFIFSILDGINQPRKSKGIVHYSIMKFV